jgi:chaperonin GroES
MLRLRRDGSVHGAGVGEPGAATGPTARNGDLALKTLDRGRRSIIRRASGWDATRIHAKTRQRSPFGPRDSFFARIKRRSRHMSKIRPLQDRVIVRRIKEEEKSRGGIIIPDTAKEKPTEGEVMAVGSGKVLEDGSVRKLDVKAGDRVLFGKYNGTEVKLDGEDRLIIREEDILGVFEP